MHLSIWLHDFSPVNWFRHIFIVFLFLPTWRWPHEWVKLVGGCYVTKLHSYTQVQSLVFLKNFTHLDYNDLEYGPIIRPCTHSNKLELKGRKITGKLKRTWFTKPLLDYGKRGQVGKKQKKNGTEKTLKILHLPACIQWNYSKIKRKKWTFRSCK